MTFPRHTWSDPYRETYATKYHCWSCGLMKITRHEPGARLWVEFWRDGVRVRAEEDRTPVCEVAVGKRVAG